ncbi:MAG TPA: IS30 family transposase [Propionicimonas sp.]|nr:IS30 family transposase [Propionicimonas sp.]
MPGARLTVEQRRTIERSYRIGLSQQQIASIIGKDKSTVSRELARSFSAPGSRSPQARSARGGGAGYRRVYDAERAQRVAQIHARRPKARRLDAARLRNQVWELLRADWSPQQISRSLPVLFPNSSVMRVSHETIYQSLFVQTKGTLKAELTAHLRTQRTRRKTQTGGAKRITLGITDDIRISARPATAADRAVPGHWEGDLLLGGTGKGAVITLVERSSRFVLLAPLPGRHTAELARLSLAEMIATLPLSLRKSITWDRGSEMAQHAQFKIETGIPIYFCDPQSPWQRGTNENTNVLLRQYAALGRRPPRAHRNRVR